MQSKSKFIDLVEECRVKFQESYEEEFGGNAKVITVFSEANTVVTFEVNDEQECFTRPWLEGAPYPARVEMVVGDVFELLPPMGLDIDVAFVDANKREYVAYYELLMPMMHSGSVMLADNTLWDG